MPRWKCGVTKIDRVKNERIRGTTQYAELSKKDQERRLQWYQWYGHEMRGDETYVGRDSVQTEVPPGGRAREDREAKVIRRKLLLVLLEKLTDVVHINDQPHGLAECNDLVKIWLRNSFRIIHCF
ncbi:uncharacterized protein LOC135209053 [Macrobrachium nipponense]|uniref:uncharacterized protein LOC135209053 n=1 Tax=Macrobrachium nipponense TaxID=159736 RepID=UPI0030C83D54